VDRPRHRGAGAGPALRRALAGRLRRALRPPRTLRPTRAGWAFFAFTLGVGFAAINTGNNLLYLVLSFMLAFLVLSGVLSESALRGLRVRRRVPREVFAGRAAPVALEITNAQRRVPAFALVVEDLAEGDVPGEPGRPLGRGFALRVAPGGTETRTYGLVAPRRGDLAFWGFRISTRFPFGLFSKAALLHAPGSALVYPALEAVTLPTPQGVEAREGEDLRLARGAGSEAQGLREYAAGDPHRRVHWRASLRQGQLLVRDTEREHGAELEVLLRTRAEPGPAFEQAVSRAGSRVVAGLEAGLRVGLRTDAARLDAEGGARQRERLLAFLARVEPDPGAREAS
jgi:uncharacterized protein (DUF58 family)